MAISDYYDGMDDIIKASGNPEVFKISPSSIEDFFTATSQYYWEQVLGNEKAFQGSTSTHLGTIVHHCAEVSATDGDTTVFDSEVEAFLAEITDDNVDKDLISLLWFDMASLLVSSTILTDHYNVNGTEEFLFEKLNDDVYVGGTYDCLIEDPAVPGGFIVVDYKTASTKPQGFSRKYKWQAYTYAWMLRNKGINVTRVQLSFVTRPTKTLPVRYFEFVEEYTDDNHAYIERILNLIAKSVSLYKANPDLRAVISQDANYTPPVPKTAFPSKV